MKKILFMVAAVALMVLTACNKDEFQGGMDAAAGTVEFVAGFDVDTKTDLADDENSKSGKKTIWTDGDKISINGYIFEVSELIDGGSSAKFVNVDDLTGFSAPYKALYPANVTEIPADQTVVAGKCDPNAVLESAESEDHNLQFTNQSSLLKFQVSASCSVVTLTSDDALAGSDAKEVTVKTNGTFEAGKDYYVAVLPGDKNNFTVMVDDCVIKSSEKVTINRSSIVNMGSLTTHVRLYVESEKTGFDMKIYAWGLDGVDLPNVWPGKTLAWDNTTSKYYYDFPLAVKDKEVSFIVNVNGDKCKTGDQKITFSDFEATYALNWKWLYLKPNSNWKQASAQFAAYFFTKNVSGEYWQWMMMLDANHYGCVIPGDYNNVIFCRMNSSATNMNWDNKWNQTGDLTIPTNGNNLFTLSSSTWDGATTTWSKKTF